MPSAKKQLNEVLKLTRSKKTYEEISQEVNRILALDEPGCTEQLKAYYAAIVKDTFESGITHRINEDNKPTFWGKRTNFNKIHGKTLATDVAKALNQMVRERKPDFKPNLSMPATDIYNIVKGFADKNNALDGLKRSGREQIIKRLVSSAEHLAATAAKRDDKSYNPNSLDNYHVELAEFYILRRERLVEYEKMMKRNAFWRFFNSGEIKKTQKFLNITGSLLAMAEFDEKKYGPIIEARLKDQPYGFMKLLIEYAEEGVKSEKKRNQMQEKMKTVEQLTVAQEKYAQADELNKNEETSLQSKWKPYLDKYGIPIGNEGVQLNYSDYKNAAVSFDKVRDTEKYTSAIKQRFLLIYGAMVRASLRNKGSVDPKEILKDTQAMVDIELKHCTIVYDHPETKSVADNNVYGGHNDFILKKRMKDAINSHNTRTDNPIPDEKINEIVSTIETELKEAREANQKRLEEEAKNEKVNEAVDNADNKEQPDNVKNENDAQRTSFAVEIPNENAVIEMAPMVKDEPDLNKSKEIVQK